MVPEYCLLYQMRDVKCIVQFREEPEKSQFAKVFGLFLTSKTTLIAANEKSNFFGKVPLFLCFLREKKKTVIDDLKNAVTSRLRKIWDISNGEK